MSDNVGAISICTTIMCAFSSIATPSTSPNSVDQQPGQHLATHHDLSSRSLMHPGDYGGRLDSRYIPMCNVSDEDTG